MKIAGLIFLISVSLIFYSCEKGNKKKVKTPEQSVNKILSDKELIDKADSLAEKFILLDTHIDLPYRLAGKMEDVTKRTKSGDFDFIRAKEGGLNSAFLAVYTQAKLEGTGRSKTEAERVIRLVEKLTGENPDKFAIAYSAADIIKHFRQGLFSFALGMENGSPIEGDLDNLTYFYKRGIRYITLAHSKNNHICDSSYELKKKWKGLSPFGIKVIEKMNRLGMMIDVSHLSDSSFYQILRLSKAPVIASHSSCRSFTPGWERNIGDEMIKALAEKGGVVMINFGSSFLRDDIRKKWDKLRSRISAYIKEHDLQGEAAEDYREKHLKDNFPGYADVKDIISHINHVVKIAGIDHVGFGSDFEGLGDTLPVGMKDVSDYPNIIYELLRSGYSDSDIQKICSGNILRVWKECESISETLKAIE